MKLVGLSLLTIWGELAYIIAIPIGLDILVKVFHRFLQEFSDCCVMAFGESRLKLLIIFLACAVISVQMKYAQG